jgi:hypothetical protein
MTSASAYILAVPHHRRQVILAGLQGSSFFGEASVGEPVPRFEHSKRVPLIVLASFEDGIITHIADGRKGVSAGTGLVRLNMTSVETLSRPIAFLELLELVPKKIRPYLERVLSRGGKLPPKTLGAVVDALIGLDPGLSTRLARFSDERAQVVANFASSERDNLAVQKESLAIALEIAGLDRDELLQWYPAPAPRSFLEGLPSARVREDAMLLADFSSVPGFQAITETTHYAAKTFENEQNPRIRLTVIMANRLPLEEQTGADLIYYNENYRCFAMVQYKAMEKGDNGPEFRWQDGDQLAQEIARMDDILSELEKIDLDIAPESFRFSSNPFFLKFCPRIIFDPDDKGLFKGIYLPLGLWKGLTTADKLKGPKGGNLLTYHNVGRYLTNSEFVALLAKSWIGTTVKQSVVLEKIIRNVLATGKTVVLAIERQAQKVADSAADKELFNESDPIKV